MKKVLFLLFIIVNCFSADKNISIDLSELNFEVLKLYSAEYPSIVIKNLSITPASNTVIREPKLLRVDLSQNAIKQSQGMFSALFADKDNNEYKVYFRYRLLADVEVARAARDIPRDKKIDNDDIEFVLIPFERMVRKSVLKDEVSGTSAKRLIKVGSVITQSDLIKTPIVMRNSTIVANIIEGELELEFEAVAMEDGSMGQVINIKNKNGRAYKAVVTGPSKVSVK